MKPATTFTAEYGCEHACQVEVILDGVHSRFTLNQMVQRADRAHDAGHAQGARVFAWMPDTTVRRAASVPA